MKDNKIFLFAGIGLFLYLWKKNFFKVTTEVKYSNGTSTKTVTNISDIVNGTTEKVDNSKNEYDYASDPNYTYSEKLGRWVSIDAK